MPKILFVSNTANFQKFNLPFMRDLRAKGWKVDYASPADESVTECDRFYDVEMPRSPLHAVRILRAVRALRRILEEGEYDVIHCHTPVGGVAARLAARALHRRGLVRVIYTAHGFHFYKGAPLVNWLVFYPVEKWLSRLTDVLITINEEDYRLASRKFVRRKKDALTGAVRGLPEVIKIDGVGVDLSRFTPPDIGRRENE